MEQIVDANMIKNFIVSKYQPGMIVFVLDQKILGGDKCNPLILLTNGRKIKDSKTRGDRPYLIISSTDECGRVTVCPIHSYKGNEDILTDQVPILCHTDNNKYYISLIEISEIVTVNEKQILSIKGAISFTALEEVFNRIKEIKFNLFHKDTINDKYFTFTRINNMIEYCKENNLSIQYGDKINILESSTNSPSTTIETIEPINNTEIGNKISSAIDKFNNRLNKTAQLQKEKEKKNNKSLIIRTRNNNAIQHVMFQIEEDIVIHGLNPKQLSDKYGIGNINDIYQMRNNILKDNNKIDCIKSRYFGLCNEENKEEEEVKGKTNDANDDSKKIPSQYTSSVDIVVLKGKKDKYGNSVTVFDKISWFTDAERTEFISDLDSDMMVKDLSNKWNISKQTIRKIRTDKTKYNL